MINLVDLAGS